MSAIRCALVLLAATWGCSTPSHSSLDVADGRVDGTSPADVDLDTDSDASECTIGGAIVCCPGQTNGCTEDRRSLLVCNPEGTGWDQSLCVDELGATTLCQTTQEKPLGYCTVCLPAVKRCGSEDAVQQCAPLGEQWLDLESCNGEQTGRVCYQGACLRLCDLNEKLNIYMGCDFWGVDLDNAFVSGGRSGFYDAAGEQYSIVVSNPHATWPAEIHIYTNEGEVLLDSDGNPLPSGDLLPGELRIYNLPRRDADGTLIKALAYRVESSIPITAYQFNPLENVNVFSNDGSLLLPSNVSGRYYLVMTREQTFEELRGYLTVVAIRDGDTIVNVDFTAPTLAGTNFRTNEPIPPYPPGHSASFTLKQYEVLNIETNEIGADLTGSLILASKDVVVFGGSEASNAPNTNHCLTDLHVCEWDGVTTCKSHADCRDKGLNTCCADHLEMQLFPIKSWGLKYLASRTFPRGKEKDVYRIIAAENGTLVTTVPPVVNIPILDKGEWIDFESDQNFEILAKKPIMVGQFLAAQDAPGPNVNSQGAQPGDAGIGDPAFMLLVPNEQFRQEYVFLAPNKYELDYVTIVVPDKTNVWFDCSELDPEKIPSSCSPLDSDEFERFGTGEYATIKFRIIDGVHRLYADKPASVYVYGYDQYVSYAYPAGLDIKDLGLIKEPGQ